MKEHELFIAIASAGSYYMDACRDIEAYLPPDESESWTDAENLLRYREESEETLEKLLNKLRADTIREYIHHINAPYEYTASYGTFVDELLEYANELEE